jgi:LmbE family N-acetylglucosaminyl deacetylase
MPGKRQYAKQALRHIAVELCRGALELGSSEFVLTDGPTVVIAPHQDDETLACGGMIARKRSEGLPVHVVFITDGAASHPRHARVSMTELSQLRHAEAMRALSCLGVERSAAHFLDEPDGSLKTISAERRGSLVTRLAALLGAIAPGEIFLPCNPDGSSEHDATFGFVTEAIAHARIAPDVWQYPVWAWWNPSLLLGHWRAARDCRRLRLEDYRQHKQQAIQCYQSQISPLEPDRVAALPASLLEVFQSDTEYFFRHELKPAR